MSVYRPYVMWRPYTLNNSFAHEASASSGVYGSVKLLTLDLHLRDNSARLNL